MNIQHISDYCPKCGFLSCQCSYIIGNPGVKDYYLMNQTLQLCPLCRGQKLVSKPPWIAGDQEIWTSSDTGLYECRVCLGKGYLKA